MKNLPVLSLPLVTSHHTVDTDVFDKQPGCFLLHGKSDGTNRPIGYLSRTLNDKEGELTRTARESFGVLVAVLLLGPYLESRRVTVRTHHAALKSVFTMSDASGELARWRLRLSQLEFGVVHYASSELQAADAMSR